MSGARLSRRHVLVTGAATASLALTGPAALTGCTPLAGTPEGPDPLESPARRAEADAVSATAVAQMAVQLGTRAGSTLAASASALAADRATHATTLRAELHRVQPRPRSSGASAPVMPPAPAPVTPDVAAAGAALTQATRAAQDEASGLVATLPGYRAALLASVAACCATHVALLS